MARPVSNKVSQILEDLRKELSSGYHAQGNQFPSNRSIAKNYGVSYQTAHRILSKLSAEGLISRKTGSGSSVTGTPQSLKEVAIVFSQRAFIEGTFGYQLRTRLEAELSRLKIKYTHIEPERLMDIPPHRYPVFWNVAPIPVGFLHQKRFCLVLNDRPSTGLYAHWVDSVSMDDFAGGLMAAQLLKEEFSIENACAVGGPKADARSIARLNGFQAVFPDANILSANSWGRPIPRALFKELAELSVDGIFCVNDRIASRVLTEIKWPSKVPRIIGFDDTPVALEHQLTTIAIPWATLIETSSNVIHRRLQNYVAPAQDSILKPQAVIRS